MGRVDGGVERLAAAFARDGSRRRSNFFFTSISPNKSFALVAAFLRMSQKFLPVFTGRKKNETSLCRRRQREALFSRFRLSSYLCNLSLHPLGEKVSGIATVRCHFPPPPFEFSEAVTWEMREEEGKKVFLSHFGNRTGKGERIGGDRIPPDLFPVRDSGSGLSFSRGMWS